MFTIEHEFDATVITLVDEGETHLAEDVTITAFEDCVTLEQLDPQTDEVMQITLSMTQLRDLAAALDLPEGAYRRSGNAVRIGRPDGIGRTIAGAGEGSGDGSGGA
jgi:hypothetical protein